MGTPTPRDLPGAHESGDNFTLRSLQGAARYRLPPRLRGTSQEPTKVATVSHFAAPREPRGIGYHPDSAGPPRSPRKWRQFHTSQPPGSREVSATTPTPRDRPGAHGNGDSFTLRSPQGAARYRLPPRLRGTSQEPTKVATVSHFAAPREPRGIGYPPD